MSEVDTVIEDRKITYEGMFSTAEVYKMIEGYFSKLGYDRVELKNSEVVRAEGKYIEIILEPYKTVSDYARYVVNIKMIFSDVKDAEAKIDGKKKRMNLGKVQILFNGYLVTDYENRWEQKPIYYFVRAMMNKYILMPVTGKYKAEIKTHVEQCSLNIKSFLNLARYQQ